MYENGRIQSQTSDIFSVPLLFWNLKVILKTPPLTEVSPPGPPPGFSCPGHCGLLIIQP